MKAWIARCGTYECERVYGVFLDENKAKIWERQHQSSDKFDSCGWLEELDVLDDDIVESELYVNYEIIYDGKKLRIIGWKISTEKEDNCCEIIGKQTICRYGEDGDCLCKIFLKEEEASEELARKTAAELIAKYKIEHADADSSLVDECLTKIKKEI